MKLTHTIKKTKLFALALCLATLLVTLGSFAPQEGAVFAAEDRITQDDIDKMQDKLDQLAKEQERLNQQLEEAKAQTGQKAALITSYERVISNYQKDIAATEELIAAYSSLIALKTKELVQKQDEYDRRRDKDTAADVEHHNALAACAGEIECPLVDNGQSRRAVTGFSRNILSCIFRIICNHFN